MVHGGYTKGSWRVHEGFMAGTRRVHGGYTKGSWRVHEGYTEVHQRFMDAIKEVLAVLTQCTQAVHGFRKNTIQIEKYDA